MIRLFKMALLTGLMAAPTAIAQPTTPAPGHYCLRTEIGVVHDDDDAPPAAPIAAPGGKLDEGLDDRRTKLGLLGVDVEISETGGQTLVAFSNYMPDNGQVVRTDAVPATRRADGGLVFTFTDNWRAPGSGLVTREGDGVVLAIARTKEADTFAGQYSSRQFGEFKLHPGTCPTNR